MKKKVRLDTLLVKRGFFPSREKAKTSLMAGLVFVNGERASKGGQSYPEDADIEIRGKACPYVSRGGIKLKRALESFSVNVKNCVAIDMGASTGGFTDCMLQEGALRMYAVDVGYGQLAWNLRQDRRVTVLERINARYLEKSHIPEEVDIITIDVSFISLTKILPVARDFLKEEGKIIALVKPQFEAGRENVGRGGVVRKKEIHGAVLEDILLFSSRSGFEVKGLDHSPLKGPAGNIEFLLYLIKRDDFPDISREELESRIELCVAKAHEFFGNFIKE